jgi:ArsR family transcriptional regulator
MKTLTLTKEAEMNATETSLIHDSERSARIAEVLKALAHPIRLRIIAILVEGDEHVNAMAERLNVSQPIISQQLRILRMRGLVEVVRESGLAVYRLAEPKLSQVVECMEQCHRF